VLQAAQIALLMDLLDGGVHERNAQTRTVPAQLAVPTLVPAGSKTGVLPMMQAATPPAPTTDAALVKDSVDAVV